MPAARYSDEFKEQVVREVVEKDRTISSVASSYDLVPQTVGNWVARYKKEHATDQDRKKASESAEIAKLRAENRELRQENEFLEKAAAFFVKGCTQPFTPFAAILGFAGALGRRLIAPLGPPPPLSTARCDHCHPVALTS